MVLKLQRIATNSSITERERDIDLPWVVEDAGESVSEKRLYLDGVAVLKT